VSRGEGLAEPVHGAGRLVAAGPQGAQVLAQLDPHALEGPGQLADLVGERLGRHDHLAAGQLPTARAVGRRDSVAGGEAADGAGHRELPDDQGQVGVQVPLASRWSSWLSIQTPAVTVPSRQRSDPAGRQPRARRSVLRRWSIDQLRTRCLHHDDDDEEGESGS
jgi:hypothetical protein